MFREIEANEPESGEELVPPRKKRKQSRAKTTKPVVKVENNIGRDRLGHAKLKKGVHKRSGFRKIVPENDGNGPLELPVLSLWPGTHSIEIAQDHMRLKEDDAGKYKDCFDVGFA